MGKKGLLLLNLGTPARPKVSDVRTYLRQFLSDPRVIDIHPLARWFLLNFVILPFRPKESAAAYASIWTEAGSPLLLYSQQVVAKLEQRFPAPAYQVVLGMRYGAPSIPRAVAELSGCEQIIIVPLFPQYSSAATGSALECALTELARGWNIPALRLIPDFYAHEAYITVLAQQLQRYLDRQPWDYVLFSYHGVPKRHVDKSAACAKRPCYQGTPCAAISADNRFCYRAQCYATTRAVVAKLQLPEQRYSVAFQSRLGRTPWIQPYTDEVLAQLVAQGVKKLFVICPSFVADCLETLEEIGMRGQEDWQQLGGETLTLIPCLNDQDAWIDALGNIVQENLA